MDGDDLFVRTTGRVVLKRTELTVRDSAGGRRSMTVLLMGPRADGWSNYVAEFRIEDLLFCRVDVTALLAALTPIPTVPS